jgi:hypothetical protein
MITVYQWDEFGLYLGNFEVDETGPLPERSTPTKPPKLTGTQVAQWQGEWVKLPAAPSPPQAPPLDWSSLIAARRYTAEMAGTTVQGMAIATDDRSQGLITGAALAAMLDPNYSIRWKTAEGFVDLTGAQIIGVASAVRAYVQACFDREADLLAAVADGSITQLMLVQGWPLNYRKD